VVAALASKKATHAAPQQPPSLMAVANGLSFAVDSYFLLLSLQWYGDAAG